MLWSLTGAVNSRFSLPVAARIFSMRSRIGWQRLVREQQRVDHDVFGELRRAALDHDDGVTRGSDDEVEIRRLATRRRSG